MKNQSKNKLIAAWTEVGYTWSKYGRAIGKVALESVADALKKTAEALDDSNYKRDNSTDRPTRVDTPVDKTAEKASCE